VGGQLEALFRKRRTWAAAYIALIPIYATIYSCLPGGGFHDSNLEHEPAFAEDGDHIRAELAAWIETETTPAWKEHGVAYQMLPVLLQVGPLTNDPIQGVVQPELDGTYAPRSTAEDGFVMEVRGILRTRLNDIAFAFRVRASLPETHSCYVRDGRHLTRRPFVFYHISYDGVSTEPIPAQPPAYPALTFPPLSVLFPSSGCNTRWPSTFQADQGLLLIPPEVTQEIFRHFVAENGDPTYASDLWFRMAYFSATTMATLGLGDITPVSNGARILVGLESVMGIVAIGLFLNAVAYRWRKQ